MTLDNAKAVQECLALDGLRTVSTIVQISCDGRAPKNDPAIFALAMASAHPDLIVRKAALNAVSQVCRTGTHLFHFAESAECFRRWGRSMRSAISGWYNEKDPNTLAVQLVKYAQRDGWSHRDMLRLAHPTAPGAAHNALYRWVAGQGSDAFQSATQKGQPALISDLPDYINGFERLRKASNAKEIVELIRQYRFTHEMIPTEWKNEVTVWEALLPHMPMTALLRNLAKMTQVGLLAPMSAATTLACSHLADEKRLRSARVHPLSVLMALKIYEQGHGDKGSLKWTPVPMIIDALNDAFYASFKTIEASGKNTLLALDVSGSMTWGNLAGMPGVTPRVASAAMSMVTARTEKNWHVMGFSNSLVNIPITSRQSLNEVIQAVEKLPMGGTDCALPMVYAKENRLEVDTFVVYTDNETWAGKIHPFQALEQYRQTMGRPAKLVVVGMTATEFSIANPKDAGMLDVVGFDSAAPAILADFARN